MKIEKIDKEKIKFYLKISLCMLLIGLWSIWLSTFPKSNRLKLAKKINTYTIPEEKKSEDTKTLETIKTADKDLSKNETKLPTLIIPESNKTPQEKIINKTEPLAEKETNKETTSNEISLPKPTNIEPVKVKNPLSQSINLSIPKTASATRKALLTNNQTPLAQPATAMSAAPLRKEIPVTMDQQKPILQKIQESTSEDKSKTELAESWAPIYLQGKRELTLKVESTVNNLDQIASQIELAGLITDSNGEKVALIKNKANNIIEILKRGEEYQGLQLLEINKNEIVLGNQTLNKTYTKRINSLNQEEVAQLMTMN